MAKDEKIEIGNMVFEGNNITVMLNIIMYLIVAILISLLLKLWGLL